MVLRATYPDAASGWQPHKATITQLYREEDRPLREVMLIMESEHGFRATEKMYKSRIKSWGLDKKNKRHEVQAILRQQARRRTSGKKSMFLLRGRPVDLADLERYARRKQIVLDPDSPPCPASSVVQDLICFTPPPTPLPLDAPVSLRNVEHFMHSFNTFVQDSLQSGLWKLGKDVMGFACILGAEYPASARDRFFLSVERGIRRYNLSDMSQAYRQWRAAFDELQIIVNSRRPSQLLCLVELVAHLAECKNEVANLLLRYLGDLVKDHADHDAPISMLQSLSRLQAEDLAGLTKISQDCSRNAFSGHFCRQSFFLLDSETILIDSGNDAQKEWGRSLSGLVAGWATYDVEALRAARSGMEILMASERYEEAERLAQIHIRRMHEMHYDGTVGGAYSHAFSYLTHLYLMAKNYDKAYECTLLKVENYFHVLEYRIDLPEDFILSSYSLLSSLAQTLGMDDEAEKWRREYEILKSRTDALAERELSALKSNPRVSLQSHDSTLHPYKRRRGSVSSHATETFAGMSVEDFRKCNCNMLAQAQPRSDEQQTGSEVCGQ